MESPGSGESPTASGDREPLLRHFREAFRKSPTAAYRDWFRAQEDLAHGHQNATAHALADDLWTLLPELAFESEEQRARFLHNLAVFFGTPGPAANIGRAKEAFAAALAFFSQHDDAGWRARALHNYATALSNLGESLPDFQDSAACFGEALTWRTPERAIARGVTSHNMGIVLRKLAAAEPARAAEHLEASAASLREAARIREAHGLPEGHALSLFHLALTLEAAGDPDARTFFEAAAERFERLGKSDSAAVARSRAAGHGNLSSDAS